MSPSPSAGPLSSGAFYGRWLGPVLARDEGVDAEQMSRLALTALGQASLRRRWPGVSSVLEGVSGDLQRRDLRLEQVLFGCRFSNPVGLAAGLAVLTQARGKQLLTRRPQLWACTFATPMPGGAWCDGVGAHNTTESRRLPFSIGI